MTTAEKTKEKGQISLLLVGLFYSVLFLVAMVWDHFRSLIKIPRTADLDHLIVLWQLLLASLMALIVIAICWRATQRFAMMRRIALEFRGFLYPLGLHDIFIISLFSAVGEEFFFRGIVQGELGLVAASLLFGLMHVGPKRHYLLWTAFAIVIGFLLGSLYIYTDNILAPTLTHF